MTSENTLEAQRLNFRKRSFIATPLAGLIAWLIVGIASFFSSLQTIIWVLFISTGCIVYLALFISKYTGESFLKKDKRKNEFDSLFLITVGQAVLIYAIAIPFFIIEPTSLPLTVGILLGIMWLPFSWITKHWVGFGHAIVRTITVLVLWYIFPEMRFATIPFAIVGIYIITLIILLKRYRYES